MHENLVNGRAGGTVTTLRELYSGPFTDAICQREIFESESTPSSSSSPPRAGAKLQERLVGCHRTRPPKEDRKLARVP